MSFVARHGLWSDEQQEAAKRLRRIVEEKNLETIRLSFPDQHGILRGKTLVASEALASLEGGCSITTTMLAKDTSHRTVFPVFTAGGGFGMKEMEGAADVLMVPDPTTFRVLPWSPTAGWLLCDIHFADGRPIPFATRQIYKSVLDRLGQRGYDFVAGLEVEFHIFKLDDARMAPEDAGQPGQPPSVSLLSHGYQYLTEQRYDQMEPALDIVRRDILALGLPLRSVEVEFGPSQCEFTFQPKTLALMLPVYGFIAATLPVWLLLCPRDYLSTYMKIGTIVLLVVGVAIVHPKILMPAVTPFGTEPAPCSPA